MERFRSIPATHADLIPVAGDGGLTLNLYRLHGRGADRPALLFGHACGFAAGSYLPLLAACGEVAQVFAFDARGHGGSDAPPPDAATYNLDRLALDLARIAGAVAATTAAPIFYVGHSMGATALLRLGSRHPEPFARVPWRGLWLFEPPVFPSADQPAYAESVHKDQALIARTATRRAHWASRDTFIAAMTGRGPFRHMTPTALAAHAAATLRPAADGDGVALCCSPAIEACTYQAFGDDSTFQALGAFPRDIPLHLVAGDATDRDTRSWVTFFAPVLAGHLRLNLTGSSPRRFTALADRGHLMPLEDAEMTWDLIRAFLSSR